MHKVVQFKAFLIGEWSCGRFGGSDPAGVGEVVAGLAGQSTVLTIGLEPKSLLSTVLLVLMPPPSNFQMEYQIKGRF